MNRFLNTIILPGLTVAMLGLTTNALAEWGGPGGPGMGHAQKGQAFEQRIDELHAKLALKEDQEKAWDSFLVSSKQLRPQERPDPLEFAGLHAPQRMEKMLAKLQEQEARMKKELVTLKTFYAVLTPQQQNIFDDAMPRPGEGRHMHK